jgi:transposase
MMYLDACSPSQILITLSTKEIDRLEVVKRVLEGRLTRVKAAALLGLDERQVRRMCAAYEAEGASGLASRRRGRPSNNRTHEGLQEEAMTLIRERYSDFGPYALATEKLAELHGLRISRETVRHWMKDAGLWLTRKQRVPRPHQPRERRACLGELVQIDGSPHAWFEDRGPECSAAWSTSTTPPGG